MIWWRVSRYHSRDGRDRVAEWYAKQDAETRSAFDTMMDLLSVTEDWFSHGDARILERRHAGLCEIILEQVHYETREDGRRKRMKHQFRPVGIITSYPSGTGAAFRPGEFILFHACTKSGGTYQHIRAFDETLELKAEFEQGKGTLHDHFGEPLEEAEEEKVP